VDRGQRDALLLGDLSSASGGGQPLPEALRAVLSYLYENGFTTTSVLHKIIREQDIVAFKHARILEVWKTWESFCNAILGALHDGGFISGSFGDGWVVTEKAIPGKELTVIRITDGEKDRRTRVTFHSEDERRARNEMQVVKNSIDSLITQVNRMRGKHPAYEKVSQYLLASTQALREVLSEGSSPSQETDEEGISSKRRRRRPEMRRGGVVRDWVFSYMRAHPMQLIPEEDIAAAFDEYDSENIQSGRFGNVNTGTIKARLRDLDRTDPGRIEWFSPPEVRRVSVMYVPPEGEDNGTVQQSDRE